MTPTFPKVEPVSKKTRVVALLREAIISGSIKTGEQIVEGKVAEQLGVGQGLIREALIELEHNGFVQRTPFSGTQVSKLSLEDAKNIFDIRILLEPLAVSLAGQKATPEKLTELANLATQAKEGARANNLDSFFEHHLAFRKRIWEISGNRYLKQTLDRLVIPLYALYLIRLSYNQASLEEAVGNPLEHQERIVAAYQCGDIEQAARITRDFLVRMKDYVGALLPLPEG
jgi:DNA-binding GntR family transcriptional regulator